MKTLFTTLLLFLCLSIFAQRGSFQTAYDKGKSEYAQGNYDAARKQFNAALRFDDCPKQNYVAVWLNCCQKMPQADNLYKSGKYKEAQAVYQEVLNLYNNDPKAKQRIADCENRLRLQSIYNDIDKQMIYIEGGAFTMGCTQEQGDDCWENEKPAHQVTVGDFYIGKYEVTQALWKVIMGNNPSYFKGDHLPVEQVNWDDVREFIRKLNIQTGKQYRLPTEAEWEFAARGGKTGKKYKYSGSDNADNVAWYSENSVDKTHVVGTKLPNELGIHDMSGNVLEWCSDWYGARTDDAQINSQDSPSNLYRVIRGGGWYFGARNMRVSYRELSTPGYRYKVLGFRLARNAK